MRYEIYKVTNELNGKVYIGLTIEGYQKRWSKHLKDMVSGSSTIFHNAIRSYGKEFFTLELVEQCSSLTHMKEREIYWISQYQSNQREFGYNMTDGGDGTYGLNLSKITKDKIKNKRLANSNDDHILLLNKKRDVISKFNSIVNLAIYLGVSKTSLYEKLNNCKELSFIDKDYIIKVQYTENIEVKTAYFYGNSPEQIKKAIEASVEKRKNDKTFITKQQEAHPGKKKFLKVDFNRNIVKEYSSQKECIRETGYTVNNIKHAARELYPIDGYFYLMAEKLDHLTPDLISEKLLNRRQIRKVGKFDSEGVLLEVYKNCQEASDKTGVNKGGINSCCLEKPGFKSAGGFIWKYVN